MASEGVDLLVVGGGITGAGIARDAAMRGLSVGLIERGDFASGTSSRSSKLIHGGLRYLEQGEIGLVLEAARERRCLTEIAPHLAQHARMAMPVHGRTSGGLLKFRAGLWAF
ncbi:MAG: FAD-dependent oxidoreductase, partial [bacterium]